MKNYFKNGKLSGKGTAAIICFCLAAVAALGIFSYNKSAKELRSELSGESGGTSETSAVVTEEAENANIAANNVPITEAAAPQEDIILEHDAFAEGDEQSQAEAAQADTDMLTGAVVRPADGEIIGAISNGELVKSKTLSVWKTHDGIDIATDQGTGVKSMAAGTVSEVTEDPMMGVTVIIDHGSGYTGYYCNLAKEVNVSAGDEVSAGTVIGEVGSTAEAEISEESHLHFGVKKNGSWTDPAKLLSGEGS